MTSGAMCGAPTTYCDTYSVSTPMAAEPMFSISVTMISSLA